MVRPKPATIWVIAGAVVILLWFALLLPRCTVECFDYETSVGIAQYCEGKRSVKCHIEEDYIRRSGFRILHECRPVQLRDFR